MEQNFEKGFLKKKKNLTKIKAVPRETEFKNEFQGKLVHQATGEMQRLMKVAS